MLTIGILIFGILLYTPPLDSNRPVNQISATYTGNFQNTFKMLFILSVNIAILVFGYKIGELLVNQLSVSRILLHQGLPWHPVIFIETFLILLFLGIKLARTNYQTIDASFFSIKAKYYLGIFLIGSSFYGLFIGTIRLIVLYFLPLIVGYIYQR